MTRAPRAVGEGAPVQVTLGRLVGGIFGLTVLLIAAFWAVATLSTSGLRDDVSAIPVSYTHLAHDLGLGFRNTETVLGFAA